MTSDKLTYIVYTHNDFCQDLSQLKFNNDITFKVGMLKQKNK